MPPVSLSVCSPSARCWPWMLLPLLVVSCTHARTTLTMPDGAWLTVPAKSTAHGVRTIDLRRVGPLGWSLGALTVVGLAPCCAFSHTAESLDVDLDPETLRDHGVDGTWLQHVVDCGWHRLHATLELVEPIAGASHWTVHVPFRPLFEAAVFGGECRWTPPEAPFANLVVRRRDPAGPLDRAVASAPLP